MLKIAIVGTGLAGLTLAHLLKGKAEITLFEKSRGVGGRISTRRADPFAFDHGAQYFTARSDEFREFIKPMIENKTIRLWTPHFVIFDQEKKIKDEVINDPFDPWFVGAPGMNAIGKFLAEDFNDNIVLNTRIERIEKSGHGWNLYDDQDKSLGHYDWVVSSAPAAQSAELMPDEFVYSKDLKSINMMGCFSVMLGFSESIYPGFEAARITGPDLSWICVNSRKPGRSGYGTNIIIQSGNHWAQSRYEHDPDDIMRHLIEQASTLTDTDLSEAEHQEMHLWRYAIAEEPKFREVLIDENTKLAVCGDWCVNGRVEAAFISAKNLAESLIPYLSRV
jgi:renalase